MSSLIRDWRELRRAWKQFAAALLSISADDLARPEGREVTRLDEGYQLPEHLRVYESRNEMPSDAPARKGLAEEERACPLMLIAPNRTVGTAVGEAACLREQCAWWVQGYKRCAVLDLAVALDAIMRDGISTQ